jgi:hypothetical protein
VIDLPLAASTLSPPSADTSDTGVIVLDGHKSIEFPVTVTGRVVVANLSSGAIKLEFDQVSLKHHFYSHIEQPDDHCRTLQ